MADILNLIIGGLVIIILIISINLFLKLKGLKTNFALLNLNLEIINRKFTEMSLKQAKSTAVGQNLYFTYRNYRRNRRYLRLLMRYLPLYGKNT